MPEWGRANNLLDREQPERVLKYGVDQLLCSHPLGTLCIEL
jgi:hypothetical protein